MGSNITPSVHRDGNWVRMKLELITRCARGNPGYRFTNVAYLLTEGFLTECFWELKKGKAPGVDGVVVEEYEANLAENIKDLVGRLKTKRYWPMPVRRVYIPKGEKGLRPLGIPTVEDKIVQMGMKKILEAIWEVDFLGVSYGSRPNRSCHDALEVVDQTIMRAPVNYIVDIDIEKFFDTVDHTWMIECLRQRITDTSFLKLVMRFLKAGIMEEGEYYETDKGTPQGGIISPVLANIYLHYILDLWTLRTMKKDIKGFYRLIRYCDDFIVCFQYREDAELFAIRLRERLGKFGLKISGAKSRIIDYGRRAWQVGRAKTFNFLGFTHYCTKTRKGGFRAGRKTDRRKFRQKLKLMNQWMKGVRNLIELKLWWKVLAQKLVGHYRYYGISGNTRELQKFYHKVKRLAFKWTNRRSQRKSWDWERFERFLRWNPLPMPKIYHQTYTLSH